MTPFHPHRTAFLSIPVLVACAAAMPSRLVQDPNPFHVPLDVGTSWTYLRVDDWVPSGPWVGTDTLRCEVAETFPPPVGPVVLDGLAPSAEAAIERLGRLPAGAMLRPYYLPPAGADSAVAAAHLEATALGEVARISCEGKATPGKYPHFLANTGAGLVDMTSWLVGYGTPLRPAYVRGDRRGDLMVPSEASGVAGWIGGRGGWFVTAVDTLISVPAGSFRCVEITYRLPPEEPGADLDSYREYWADEVGLVAWVDLRTYGDGIWILLPR